MAGGACGWNGCCRPGKASGMKSEQRIWGKSGQSEATMRVGVVLLGRLERDWNHPQLEQLLLPSLFPTITTLLSPAPSSYTFFPSLQRDPTGAPNQFYKRTSH